MCDVDEINNNFVGTRVTDATKQALQRSAKQRRWSVSEYIRHAIEQTVRDDAA